MTDEAASTHSDASDTSTGSPRRAQPGTFRSAWSHRRWRWMFGSYAISVVGDFVYSVALVVFVLDRTGSAAWVSAAAVARLVPYVLLGPLAGVLADRVNRRRLMVALDVVQAALLAAMALVVATGGPVIVAIALAGLSSSASVPYRAAAVATTPRLVPEDDLAAANAAESIVAQAAWFVGPALGAALVAAFGVGWAFLVDAGTFVVAALLVSRAGDLGGGREAAGRASEIGTAAATDTDAATGTDADVEPETSGLIGGLVEGVDAIRTDRGLAALVMFVSILMLGFGMEQVLHVFVAVDRLGAGAEWVGVMGASIGIGGLVVAPLTARIARGSSAGWALVISGVMSGVPLAALAVTDSRTLVLVLLAIEGAAVIVNEVMLVTMLQRACPEHLLGRVYGLQDSSSAITQLVGSLIVPVMVGVLGLQVALAIGGGVTVVGTLLLTPPLLALGRRGEAERLALAPLVDELRAVAIFADLGEGALTRLARGATIERREIGEIVLAEDDPADDLYVVRSGALVVHSMGGAGVVAREVNRMGPGDWFGEIGLLQRRPRTATVTVTEPVGLVRVPGDVFVDGLAAPEVLPDPVRRTVAARLARTHPTEVPT
jgi:MFS family permease